MKPNVGNLFGRDKATIAKLTQMAYDMIELALLGQVGRDTVYEMLHSQGKDQKTLLDLVTKDVAFDWKNKFGMKHHVENTELIPVLTSWNAADGAEKEETEEMIRDMIKTGGFRIPMESVSIDEKENLLSIVDSWNKIHAEKC